MVNPGLVLLAVMLGTFLSILDTTILNVALPYIMAAFGSDVEHAKWATTGFFLGATVSMPLSGWLGSRFGNATVFVVSLAIFTVGAGLSSVAWSLDALIASRILQGISAGVVQPIAIAILTQAFPPEIRGRVFGIWAIGMMTAPSLGPVTGGVIIEFIDWRAIFLLSAVVGVMAVLLAATVLEKQVSEPPKPFDWPGYLALTSFLVTGFLTVNYGQQEGWDSEIIVAGMIGTLASFAIFIVLEWGEADAILPLRMFRERDFALASCITVFRALGLFGPIFLLPIFLFQIQGRASIDIGLILMPGSVVMALSSPIAGAITDRIGGRWPTVAGVVCIAVALFMYRDIDFLTNTRRLVLPLMLQGLGIAFVMTPVITTGMNAVHRSDAGHAAWVLNLCQRAGGAFAITLLGTYLHRQTMIHQDILGDTLKMQQPAWSAFNSLSLAAGQSAIDAQSAFLAGAMHYIGQAAAALAFKNLFTFSAVVTIVAVIPALLLASKRKPA